MEGYLNLCENGILMVFEWMDVPTWEGPLHLEKKSIIETRLEK